MPTLVVPEPEQGRGAFGDDDRVLPERIPRSPSPDGAGSVVSAASNEEGGARDGAGHKGGIAGGGGEDERLRPGEEEAVKPRGAGARVDEDGEDKDERGVDDGNAERSDRRDSSPGERGNEGAGAPSAPSAFDAWWLERYEELREFRREHGHFRVPFASRGGLAKWASRQRRHYKNRLRGKGPSLNDERVRLLDEIGFLWTVPPNGDVPLKERLWFERYEELREVISCPVPESNYLAASSRRSSSSRSRSPSRKSSAGSTATSGSPTARGASWRFGRTGSAAGSGTRGSGGTTSARGCSTRSDSRGRRPARPTGTNTTYEMLLEFRSEHGHCRVPGKYPPNPALSKWCRAQRQAFSGRCRGCKKHRLSDERVRLLNEIGFVWRYDKAADDDRNKEARDKEVAPGNGRGEGSHAGAEGGGAELPEAREGSSPDDGAAAGVARLSAVMLHPEMMKAAAEVGAALGLDPKVSSASYALLSDDELQRLQSCVASRPAAASRNVSMAAPQQILMWQAALQQAVTQQQQSVMAQEVLHQALMQQTAMQEAMMGQASAQQAVLRQAVMQHILLQQAVMQQAVMQQDILERALMLNQAAMVPDGDIAVMARRSCDLPTNQVGRGTFNAAGSRAVDDMANRHAKKEKNAEAVGRSRQEGDDLPSSVAEGAAKCSAAAGVEIEDPSEPCRQPILEVRSASAGTGGCLADDQAELENSAKVHESLSQQEDDQTEGSIESNFAAKKELKDSCIVDVANEGHGRENFAKVPGGPMPEEDDNSKAAVESIPAKRDNSSTVCQSPGANLAPEESNSVKGFYNEMRKEEDQPASNKGCAESNSPVEMELIDYANKCDLSQEMPRCAKAADAAADVATCPLVGQEHSSKDFDSLAQEADQLPSDAESSERAHPPGPGEKGVTPHNEGHNHSATGIADGSSHKRKAKQCKRDGCNNAAGSGGTCLKHRAKKGETKQCRRRARRGRTPTRLCGREGCPRKVLIGGLCARHGAENRCVHEGCKSVAVSDGVCCKHGAKRKLCSFEGCTNFSIEGIEGQLCRKHGCHRKYCSHGGCTNFAMKGGVCYNHGAKRELCSFEGCSNFSSQDIKGGVCSNHRKYRHRCSHEGCTIIVRKKARFCLRHIGAAEALRP